MLVVSWPESKETDFVETSYESTVANKRIPADVTGDLGLPRRQGRRL